MAPRRSDRRWLSRMALRCLNRTRFFTGRICPRSVFCRPVKDPVEQQHARITDGDGCANATPHVHTMYSGSRRATHLSRICELAGKARRRKRVSCRHSLSTGGVVCTQKNTLGIHQEMAGRMQYVGMTYVLPHPPGSNFPHPGDGPFLMSPQSTQEGVVVSAHPRTVMQSFSPATAASCRPSGSFRL